MGMPSLCSNCRPGAPPCLHLGCCLESPPVTFCCQQRWAEGQYKVQVLGVLGGPGEKIDGGRLCICIIKRHAVKELLHRTSAEFVLGKVFPVVT